VNVQQYRKNPGMQSLPGYETFMVSFHIHRRGGATQESGMGVLDEKPVQQVEQHAEVDFTWKNLRSQ
jgi:hypothetical protein